jgi:hypothetical protein
MVVEIHCLPLCGLQLNPTPLLGTQKSISFFFKAVESGEKLEKRNSTFCQDCPGNERRIEEVAFRLFRILPSTFHSVFFCIC